MKATLALITLISLLLGMASPAFPDDVFVESDYVLSDVEEEYPVGIEEEAPSVFSEDEETIVEEMDSECEEMWESDDLPEMAESESAFIDEEIQLVPDEEPVYEEEPVSEQERPLAGAEFEAFEPDIVMEGETLSALTPKEWLQPCSVLHAFPRNEDFIMGGNNYSDGWECWLEYYGNSTTNHSEVNYNLEQLFSFVNFDIGGTYGRGEFTANLRIELDGITYLETVITQGEAPVTYSVPTSGVSHLRIAFESNVSNASHYTIANVNPVPIGTLPEKSHYSSNWRWNDEPISKTNVYERNPVSFGGRTYDDGFLYRLAYQGNETSGIAYMSFNMKKHYTFVSFDVGMIGFNGTDPYTGAHTNALLTITKDGVTEETQLYWNDVPRRIITDVSGVTNLEIRIQASSSNSDDYGLGALQFFSDGVVTGIRLEESGKTINLDKSNIKKELHAHVVPADAMDKGVVWSSEDESIAYVDADGIVWARGNGTTKVTATTESAGDGGPFSQSVTVKVTGIYPLEPPAGLLAKVSDRGKCTTEFYPRNGAFGYKIQYSTDKNFGTYDEISVDADNLAVSADNEDKRFLFWQFDGNGAAKGYIRVASYYMLGDYEVIGSFNKTPAEVVFAYYSERDGWSIPNTEIGFGDNYTFPFYAWIKGYGLFEKNRVTYLTKIYYEIYKQGKGEFTGNCFGTALLSAANYNKQIDLKNMFQKEGDGLSEYGFSIIKSSSDGRQAFSVAGNKEALDLIELMMVSQVSVELKKAELDWDFKDLQDYLNDSSSTKPVLVTLEGENCHTVLVYPDGKLHTGNTFTVPIFDPNAPEGKDMLNKPTTDYSNSGTLTLTIGNIVDSFAYNGKGESGSLSISGYREIAFHKHVHFYDVSKLPQSYFKGNYTIRSGMFDIQWFGSNIKDIDIFENGSPVMSMKGGKLTSLSEGYDYTTIAMGSAGGESLRMLPLTGGKLSYTSSPGTVVLTNGDQGHSYAVTTTVDTLVTYDPKKEAISLKGNEAGEASVSMSMGENGELSVDVKVNIQKDEELTLTEKEGDLAITADKKTTAQIKITNEEQTIAEGQITVPAGSKTTYINTSENKIETVSDELGGVITAVPTVKLSKTKLIYTGKELKPTVTVSVLGKVLSKDDYTLSYSSGRVNVGTYTIKVELKGNYKGSKTVSYMINPPKMTFVGVTPDKGGFTAKWIAKTPQTTGYHIQYATDPDFKNQHVVGSNGTKATTRKIIKQPSNKKYYVRMRIFKKIGDKTYYGPWTKAKTVTTK